jgi:hypothetical protein
MHFYMHSYLHKIFILVKSGCYNDGSSNPEEFIQVYHVVIEAAGGDDRVKANYLPTVLFDAARS